MRMRVMVAAMMAVALGAAACGEPSTVGESAQAAATTAASETTTTTEPGPPTYNVSLDVAYLEDYSSVYHVGFPQELPDTTYGFEVTYRLNATIEEAEFVEPDAAGTLNWWIYDYDYVAVELIDSWTGTEPADFDIPAGSAVFGGATRMLREPDDHRPSVWHLGAAVRLETRLTSSGWSTAYRQPSRWPTHARTLPGTTGPPGAWSGIRARLPPASPTKANSRRSTGSTVGGQPQRKERVPRLLETDDEHSGCVVWSMPLDDLGIETHEVDFEFREERGQCTSATCTSPARSPRPATSQRPQMRSPPRSGILGRGVNEGWTEHE